MRVSKPIILFVPTILVAQLNKRLLANPPNFSCKLEYFYFVINHLIAVHNQNKDRDFVPLNMKLLKSVTASNIGRYVKLLRDEGFIISDGLMSPGQKSLFYKFNDQLKGEYTKVEVSPKSKMGKAILAGLKRKKKNYNRQQPHLTEMRKAFMALDMDYVASMKWIDENANNNQKELSYKIAITHIQDKRFRYFKRNKTNGRLDTNLTNLKKDLKAYIVGDIVSIDLRNSQPFLLGVLIYRVLEMILPGKRSGRNSFIYCDQLSLSNIHKTFGRLAFRKISKILQDWGKDDLRNLSLFLQSVKQGVFYDDFLTQFDGDITRSEVKKIMFEVLFSKNIVETDIGRFVPFNESKKKFASVYPEVYEIVKILKGKDNRLLPIFLQKMESFLFIDLIAKKCVEVGIVPFTIHDSVIVKREEQKQAVSIMIAVSRQTLNRWERQKLLVPMRIGTQVRYSVNEIINTLNSNKNARA